MKQAQVQYDDAKDMYDRTQKLFDGGTASRQQLDSAKAHFDSAVIALDTAKQNLSMLQDKGPAQSTGVASSPGGSGAGNGRPRRVAALQHDHPLAPERRGRFRNVDPGELVATGTPAFVVIDQSTVTAETSVEEGTVEKIHVEDDRSPVIVDAAGNARLSGVVQTVSPSADPRTQGYTVKVRIDSPEAALRPGMFAVSPSPSRRRRTCSSSPTPPS